MSMPTKKLVSSTAVLAGTTLLLLLLGLLAASSGNSAEQRPKSAAEKSQLLQSAAAIRDLNAGRYHRDRDEILRRAGEIASTIPLPPGGSLDDAHPGAAADQGGISDAFLETVLQNNAACDWYEYAARQDPIDRETMQMMQEIPHWSVFREDPGDLGEVTSRVAAALRKGDRGPLEFRASRACADPPG
jgi:hypothetical protein